MPYHASLGCNVVSVYHDYVTKLGVLHLEPHNECFGGMCIEFFERIDPDVTMISVFVSDMPEAIYVREEKLWREYLRDSASPAAQTAWIAQLAEMMSREAVTDKRNRDALDRLTRRRHVRHFEDMPMTGRVQ